MTVPLTIEQAAERAGVEPAYLLRLRELGIVPGAGDAFSDGDVRRALTARSLEGAGIPLDVLGDAIRRGALNLNFLDSEAYERFAGLCDETFQQVSDRTDVPVELLMAIRESIGMASRRPVIGCAKTSSRSSRSWSCRWRRGSERRRSSGCSV